MFNSPIKNTQKNWDKKDIPNLEGKTALITGANGYLGKALVQKLSLKKRNLYQLLKAK